MPRSARIAPGGLLYHVLNRSSGRFNLFRAEKDFLAFRKTLGEALERFPGVRLLAFCIMSNHWHLILWPQRDGELAAFMHWLTLAHASRWRSAHRTIGLGPLYRGRYKSFVIETDEHYFIAMRYVERNARRAKLVARAEDWRWGSLHARSCDDPQVMAMLSEGPLALPPNWKAIVNATQSAGDEQAVTTSIHRSRPFGSERWQKRMCARLKLLSCMRPRGRPPTRQPR